MTHIENTESHPKRSTGTRVFLLIASAVTSLIAIGLVAFDFDQGTLLLTEAGSKRRASLHVVGGSAGLAFNLFWLRADGSGW